jgi:hypothetical protein
MPDHHHLLSRLADEALPVLKVALHLGWLWRE